jgi:phosphatidylinositol alpha-mannosyltransferase
VALVCPYSWSRPGGVQSHVAGLARALRARDVEVDVLAPADDDAARVEVVALGRSLPIPDNGSVQRVALSPAAAARTVSRVRGYDLVHLHEPMIPFTCLAALVTAPVPLVGTFHMYAGSPRWYRVFGALSRRALGRLRIRIAVSEAARRHVERTCPGDYEIVPNGVNVPERPHAQAGPGRTGFGGTVLFVGRAEPRKGLPVLLEAARRLPEDVRLELVGVGADELPPAANGNVVAHGRVPDRERDRLLASADVLCAPSLGGESFGLVLAEAMAAGTPVVASDVDGYRELVRDDCGRLVPPGDAATLAGSLRELLDDAPLRARLAAGARERVRPLAWPHVADRILDLYERALA